jgi:phage terminase small subunit
VAGVKGRSGRPRLSADEHRLRGTFRSDRHGSVPAIHMPVARAAVDPPVLPPVGLTPRERTYWAAVAPLLASAHLLTPADRETLADYCRACVAIDECGQRRRTALHRTVLDQPLVRLLDTAVRGWMALKTRLAGELGLTRIARTRIGWTGHPPSLETTQKPLSALAQLQKAAAAMRRPVRLK